MKNFTYKLGIDIGSTTAKIAILDNDNKIVFADYARHNAEISSSLVSMITKAKEYIGDEPLRVAITGTAGMGVSENTGLYFVQEVVAAAEVVKTCYPDVRTLIDLGGEDAKIIFFNDEMKPNIRMNGNCAGGTGAFIDQMASLLNVAAEDLSSLAEKSTHVYSIASRCGVFAKTDVQNLISRDVTKEDIAASIFRAVALQTVNSLGRGFDILPQVLFCGGPLTFISALREAFKSVLKIEEEDIFLPERPELIPAIGSAIMAEESKQTITLSDIIKLASAKRVYTATHSLPPLFENKEHFVKWKEKKEAFKVSRTTLKEASGKNLFLGIDSGSTTTKVVLVDEEGRLVFSKYTPNKGMPIQTVKKALEELNEKAKEEAVIINIARASVTGYGEDLIKAAFNLDEGHVETIAHYKAACKFNPAVSFILDIGGQDMKAIFINSGIINNLEINEACSSGAGSFIETFANSMGLTTAEFAKSACDASSPADLGTRCTVFMNSKVKQALREGSPLSDISAGLAYSVIKNCFNKLLKINNFSILGDTIVVQGGTFKNAAVLRAMEIVLGKEVIRPEIAELMGAYGCALIATENYDGEKSKFIGFDNLKRSLTYEKKTLTCRGCENTCRITRLKFDDGEIFYTGNKCEKIYSSRAEAAHKGVNMHERKRELIFNRSMEAVGKSRLTIGIPRALNMFDNFPFWNTLFTECGFTVSLSSPSNMEIAEKGAGTVMSENICFPAKLAHGHIIDLIEKKVDRIFYPMVRFEVPSHDDATNAYNCPVVTGYPDVIKSSIDPSGKYNIPFDNPPISFLNNKLLKKSSFEYFKSLGIKEKFFKKAFAKALNEQKKWKEKLKEEAKILIKKAKEEKRLVIITVGRPYHIDPLINHKLPSTIASLGAHVIPEDAIETAADGTLSAQTDVLTQWSYPNRVYNAAIWAGTEDNVEVVQTNSFGCGPDAVSVEEVKILLNSYGKNPTLIRIDEIASPGSMRLRLRSMLESALMREVPKRKKTPRVRTALFTEDVKTKKIIAPLFSPMYKNFIKSGISAMGYDFEILPMPDRKSVEIGLKYTNNDICYPATIVIGDIIKALESGKYNAEETAVAISQTGGQCRASNYLSLLKRALINAGFENVPVLSVSTSSNPINEQPGFSLNPINFNVTALFNILFADALSKMYYYTAVREKNKGSAQRLLDVYLTRAESCVGLSSFKVLDLLKEAVDDFNGIDINKGNYPRVGIVGEIYVKYNPFANGEVGAWLMEQGIEPDVPPLLDFFLKKFVSEEYNHKNNVQDYSKLYINALKAVEKVVEFYIDKTNRIMKKFRGYRKIHSIREVASKAENILSFVNQFGESWLLPAEIASFAESDVDDVLCLQPFGCIANHVIARGVEKRLKDLYPHLNLLYLDMDAGISEVNSINRLQFLVRGAKDKQKNESASKLSIR